MGTLPGSPLRRGDAFEHDISVAALRPAFDAAGLELVEIDWRAPMEDFAGCAAALIGTPWDYHDHESAFLDRLKALDAAGIRVFNDWEIVVWNSDKRYLDDLAEAGVPTIPTLWHPDPDRAAISEALDHFSAKSVVVKRQVGAGAEGQHRFTRDSLPAADWRMGHAAMIQPFLPVIEQEGELTFVFIDGRFSHGVRKTAAEGEYRIQSIYGGAEVNFEPSASELAQAEAVMAALPFAAPLYARIDMIRLEGETLAVMEAEMIEPYLYPEQGPELGERLASAVAARLANA
ncbi:RimK family alpha-L-glutamate ligase [Qipengyuania sp.]|uniref:ATP-grasp domain-containing protein n=1 Tax=Qipengyuania sp. TaxID=2004515 RepID=UPI0035C7C7BD